MGELAEMIVPFPIKNIPTKVVGTGPDQDHREKSRSRAHLPGGQLIREGPIW